MTNSLVNRVGFGKRNKSKSSILLHGVQVTNISNNKFSDSPSIAVLHTVGEPVTSITNNLFVNTPEATVKELNSDKLNTATISDNTYQ